MKEETKQRKQKQQKLKDDLKTFKKERGLKTFKLSKQEENQLLLSSLKTKSIEEEIDETKPINSRRIYNCSCGCQVTLEGDISKQKIREEFELCSKCSL